MSICYEFGFDCQIKQDVSQEILETLNYMTRSQEYDFDPPEIDHPMFKEGSDWKWTFEVDGQKRTVIRYEWRTFLCNYPREGEQYLLGKFGSTFENYRLCCRRLSRDDEFDNVWWLLLPWIASISETTGFVGYYRGNFDDSPTLLRFEGKKCHAYELISGKYPRIDKTPEEKQEPVISLELDDMTETVKQELLRQAENPKMSLEEYMALVSAQKDLDAEIYLEIGNNWKFHF